MGKKIIYDIRSIDDFKIIINEVIDKTQIEIFKNTFDVKVLISDDKQLINYFESKRIELLKKFKKNSFSLRISFDQNTIKINDEDYDQLFLLPTKVYDWLNQIKWSKEEFINEKKDLNKYYKKRLKDIKNNIWLSYYDHKILELKEVASNVFKNEVYPFHKLETYDLFCEYLKNHIVVPYNDLSYLFQRLEHEKLIEHVTHRYFFKWLHKREFILKKDYDFFFEKGQFYSLEKSSTPQRENNFNNQFDL
jgi:hypothetical protein